MEGRKEVSIISHGPVSSRDLKLERLFFRWSVSTILQLVAAFQLILLIFSVEKNDKSGFLIKSLRLEISELQNMDGLCACF